MPDLADICLAWTRATRPCDLLLVRPSQENSVLICAATYAKEISIRELPIPADIDIEFAFDDAEQDEATRRSYEFFREWAGILFTEATTRRDLLVKVDESALWFLRFPISSYINLRLGEFVGIAGIHWIVTQRSFTETVINRIGLENGLGNLAAIVEGTVVVLNVYEHHLRSGAGKDVADSVKLLRLLLREFENVDIEGQPRSLRLACNPSAEELTRVLIDPRTRFVFAAFEADEGTWELAGRPSSELSASFSLEQLKCKLEHIQLLRVFHCNSVFSPYAGEPASRATIARQLLETGAQFVEGGLTRESYFDFVRAVMYLIFQSPLGVILLGNPKGSRILARCNRILKSHGLEPVSVAAF